MSVIVENKELNCYGMGETRAEAEADLQEHLRYYANFYCGTNASELTGVALGLKRKFEKLKENQNV